MAQAAKQIELGARDQAHAYNPQTQPEYFGAVLGRRIVAFFADLVIIVALTVASYSILLVAGIFTLGLAWLLLGVAFPAIALGYYAWTLSRPESATLGMRLMSLQMRTWYGSRMYALLGAFHALLFYFSVAVLTPLILLIAPFNARKRCLHDFFAGTVVINSEERARSLKG